MNSNNIPRKWKMKVTPELSKRVQEIVFRSARGWIDKGTIIQGLYMPWLVYDRGFLLAANNTTEIKEEFHEISAYAYITTNGKQKWLPNYGEECLVSSDGIKWYEAKYCSYIPDSDFPVIVDSRTSYKFVKKAIQKTYADFVSFLDELGILYKFSDNCETTNQRWRDVSSYYTNGIQEFSSKIDDISPENYIKKAFSLQNSNIVDIYEIDKKWCELVKNVDVVTFDKYNKISNIGFINLL